MSFTETLLVQCLLFIPLPYILFAAFKSRRVMPLAVLQVLVGVVMGPSLFGRVYPELFAEIFRPDTVAPLRGIALIAVLLFAFITGLHLDLTRLRGRAAALWHSLGGEPRGSVRGRSGLRDMDRQPR